eukprot:19902-Heterococcus_DN1.PRE.3
MSLSLKRLGRTCADGYKHVRIACLDEQTAKLVTHLGLHCTASTKEEDNALHPGDREDAWLYRWHASMHMLHAGYDVIATDADALWVNNPLQSCLSGVHADMLVSQGGGNPVESIPIFGSPVCMGFLYIRSSRKARALIADMVQALEAGTYGDKDDQKAFNLMLMSRDYYVTKANRQQTNVLHYFETKPGSAANATGELATIARLPWSCADRGNGHFPDSKSMQSLTYFVNTFS